MNEFAKRKMNLALIFGILLFLLLGAVIFLADISAEAKVAIAMAMVAAFGSIINAYWRKTSTEEKVNPDTLNGDVSSFGSKAPKKSPPKSSPKAISGQPVTGSQGTGMPAEPTDIPSPVESCGSSGAEPQFDDSVIPPANMDARSKYEKIMRGDFTLTDLNNPAQIEKDYIGYFEKQLAAAKAMYRAIRGVESPQNIEDSCQSGDWSFEAKAVLHAARELQQAYDQIANIKAHNPEYNAQLGGLGYLLNGINWNDMPQWARDGLYQHTVLGKQNPPPLNI